MSAKVIPFRKTAVREEVELTRREITKMTVQVQVLDARLARIESLLTLLENNAAQERSEPIN